MTYTQHGWHFLPADRKVPRLGTLIVQGLVEEHSGPLKPCESGLHFSVRPIDALNYAPGTVLHEVEVSGEIVMDTDKGVASRRTTLWIDDVEPILRAFARHCALSVIEKWQPAEVVLRYLKDGEGKDRDATRTAAWVAAMAAATAPAWAAATATAWAAAMSPAATDTDAATAWDAAIDAAAVATRAATGVAAREAARDAQNRTLLEMIVEFRNGKREWRFTK